MRLTFSMFHERRSPFVESRYLLHFYSVHLPAHVLDDGDDMKNVKYIWIIFYFTYDDFLFFNIFLEESERMCINFIKKSLQEKKSGDEEFSRFLSLNVNIILIYLSEFHGRWM